LGGYRDVRYDLNNNGYLEIDFGLAAAETNALNSVVVPNAQNVIIVRDLKCYFYLGVAANAGDTTLTFKPAYSSSSLTNIEVCTSPPTSYTLGTGATSESVSFDSRSGNVFTLSTPLQYAHPPADGILMPIAGLSGNPIILKEVGMSGLDELYWTIGHEIAHSMLLLSDVTDGTNLMHFTTISAVDAAHYRLRFNPRFLHYVPGTENQWETIVRP
jgi:hypothetical protein